MGYYKRSINKYQRKIEYIRLHVSKEDKELGIPGYKNIIKEQASKLGKSTTAYIMDLIEEDIRTNKGGLYINDFHIIRGMKASIRASVVVGWCSFCVWLHN